MSLFHSNTWAFFSHVTSSHIKTILPFITKNKIAGLVCFLFWQRSATASIDFSVILESLTGSSNIWSSSEESHTLHCWRCRIHKLSQSCRAKENSSVSIDRWKDLTFPLESGVSTVVGCFKNLRLTWYYCLKSSKNIL